MKAALLAGLVFAGACTLCSAGELLKNPGFETRDFTGWATSGTGWTIDKERFSEGTYSALCTVEKGDPPATRACLQSIEGIAANKIVEVSLDVSGINVAQTPHSKACLAILCMNSAGNVLKEYRSSVIMPSSSFKQIKIDDAVVLPGTKKIYVMLVVEVYETATDGDWWRFDNVAIAIH